MTRMHRQAVMKICGACFLVASLPCVAAAQTPTEVESSHRSPPTAAYVDDELIFVLQNEGKRLLSAHLQERGVFRSISLAVSIETGTSTLIADFGAGFLPGPDEGYAEMFLHTLANTFRHYAEQAGVVVHDVDFLFQGMPLEYYFPEDLAVPRPVASSASTSHSEVPRTPTPFRAQAAMLFRAGQGGMACGGAAVIVQGLPCGRHDIGETVQEKCMSGIGRG